jgi:hypothetical protein
MKRLGLVLGGVVADLLHSHYGELPISAGLQPKGQLLQIYASPATGTWTVVTTSPQGLSCVMATGQRWADGSAIAPDLPVKR